jgi:polysaccharide export outer membrane protein
LPPTEVYTVGVGDVLFVNLRNAPRGTGYFTVRSDGTLDFPLAGENIRASGRTAAQIEQILTAGITLFEQPQVEVRVREYTSHKVTVSGLVDAPGEKCLQRDAVPLYVIKAGAGVARLATRAIVTHAKRPQTFALGDNQTDNLLIFPGDSIEFTNEAGMRDVNAAYYFIGGNVALAGQKPLVPGLTLYQALIASGGVKGDPKKAVIRRKTDNGVLAVSEHNLKAIRDGRAVDPALAAGDIVEVRN